MAGINKVILLGNLGKDPEMRHTTSGVPVCSFPVATSETYTDRQSGERRTQTEWHNVVLWRRLAEIAEQYLQKGSQVYIEGKIRTRSWDDENGNKRYTTEVVGDQMQLLGRPQGDDTRQTQQGNRSQQHSYAGSSSADQSKGGEQANDLSNDGGADDLPF